MASENPSVGFILEDFRKLSIRANNQDILKHKQEKAVNCLPEERDQHVFAVMPTGCGEHFIFKLFGTAVMIKKVHKGQHSDSVVFVTCPLTSIIQDQVKEGKSLGLDCAAIKDVKDLSNVASGKTQVLCA